jgi:CubicO group peptidase (beta-lactamase class C family)
VGTFVDAAVRDAMHDNGIAGVSVAIVDRSGIVLTRGYGVASLSPARPADADTLFRVGSISKTAVWIGVMQLVEAGKIGLDDPINNHLPPELAIPEEGIGHPILVRHLMTHSAGFEDSVIQDSFERDPERLLPLNEALRRHRVHRVREPGVVSVYSNYGAALAAAMIAHVSGESWQDYAERHVFRPLGMMTATYREPYPEAAAGSHGLVAPMPLELAGRLAEGFSYDSGTLRSRPFEYVTNFAPAGSLSASANDMALYLQALLVPELMAKAGVLRTDTAMIMRTPLAGNDPRLGLWRYGFMDFSASRGRPSFGHHGDIIYQHSTLEIYPNAGIAVFVSVNTPTGFSLLDSLPAGILNTFVGPVPVPQRGADALAQARRVVGVYSSLLRPSFRTERALMRLLSYTTVTAEADGDILEGGQRFVPVGNGVFEHPDGSGRIAFHEVGGRMRLYDSLSLSPADRVGFFEGRSWLVLIAAVSVLIALLGLVATVVSIFKLAESGRRATQILGALCLLWLLAFAAFVISISAWLADSRALVFVYPGKLFPIACWLFLAATLATPIAAIFVFGPLRPKQWSGWQRIQQCATFGAFAALCMTLYAWGLLGFSGW